MAGLQEVPTDELLSFQDFPPVHNPNNFSNTNTTIPILVDMPKETVKDFNDLQKESENIKDPLEENTSADTKSFWTLKYYQKFFDIDTAEVIERLIASVIPRRNDFLTSKIKLKPDLYGPFWISVTLIFTVAISGNVANYLQHANAQYHWKYDFHLVSYAATAIVLYISLVPLLFWILLNRSSDIADLDGLEDGTITGPLELICIYGYSLFIYIPVSILWTIQVVWFQWLLVLIAALLSGSVLVYTLMPALRLSRHKCFLILGVLGCHLLLAMGFMLYFFHVPNSPVVVAHDNKLISQISTNTTSH
ncbi:hypothetical protein ILUMI_22082 [Ignelater luminosus]|uniref:Protein YIPF n=1 Tax=Ignelater luminosus TaxID=2038154 RepID=A0A8K0G355_IGNLU|nr:hypothetical protein ILUMI_22082 [Ignelater luminosus]